MTQLIEQSLVPKATHLDFIAPKQFTRSTWFDLIFFFNFEQSFNPEKMEATIWPGWKNSMPNVLRHPIQKNNWNVIL